MWGLWTNRGKRINRPKLRPDLRCQLARIKPARGEGMPYYPCLVTKLDGTEVDCVYVSERELYMDHWGVEPEHDRGKQSLPVAEVLTLHESPIRLPLAFAQKIYDAGESGMGYCIFTLIFADERRQAYETGNAIDFLQYPDGVGPQDVVDVLPHIGREAAKLYGRRYWWCLYAE